LTEESIQDLLRYEWVTSQDRRCDITLRRVRVTIVAVEKAISITYSECMFVALGIQHVHAPYFLLWPSRF